MRKLKPVKVWAIAFANAEELTQTEVFEICLDSEQAKESIDVYGPKDLRVIPCMLVPIEPKKRQVRP